MELCFLISVGTQTVVGDSDHFCIKFPCHLCLSKDILGISYACLRLSEPSFLF